MDNVQQLLQEKQNKSFGLFLLGWLTLDLENFVLNSILEFRSLTSPLIGFEYQELDLSSKVPWEL